jgi:putative Mn2+ efflux pump MntP
MSTILILIGVLTTFLLAFFVAVWHGLLAGAIVFAIGYVIASVGMRMHDDEHSARSDRRQREEKAERAAAERDRELLELRRRVADLEATRKVDDRS